MSPYYEKGKKGEKKNTPLVSPTTQPHSKNNSLKKITPYPSQYQF
jgi:hypothetical protein